MLTLFYATESRLFLGCLATPDDHGLIEQAPAQKTQFHARCVLCFKRVAVCPVQGCAVAKCCAQRRTYNAEQTRRPRPVVSNGKLQQTSDGKLFLSRQSLLQATLRSSRKLAIPVQANKTRFKGGTLVLPRISAVNPSNTLAHLFTVQAVAIPDLLQRLSPRALPKTQQNSPDSVCQTLVTKHHTSSSFTHPPSATTISLMTLTRPRCNSDASAAFPSNQVTGSSQHSPLACRRGQLEKMSKHRS